jgi:hypothetical protein
MCGLFCIGLRWFFLGAQCCPVRERFALEKMVGAKSAALFASRMSNERSADELRPQKMERVNGVAPSSQPWHGRILLLNHTRQLNKECKV